jgi:hypothetical protein
MKRLLMAPLILLAACATKSEVKGMPPDTGLKAVYKEPFEKVKLAAQHTALELGFKLKEEWMASEHSTYILYSQSMAPGSGRWLRYHIPTGEAERVTYVFVQSKSESNDNRRTDDLLAQEIHKKIAARLAAK